MRGQAIMPVLNRFSRLSWSKPKSEEVEGELVDVNEYDQPPQLSVNIQPTDFQNILISVDIPNFESLINSIDQEIDYYMSASPSFSPSFSPEGSKICSTSSSVYSPLSPSDQSDSINVEIDRFGLMSLGQSLKEVPSPILKELETRASDRETKLCEHQKEPRIKSFLAPAFANKKDQVLPEVCGDIVILGVYRGSILRDKKSGKQISCSAMTFGLKSSNEFYMGPSDQDELDTEENIYPDGMITHLGPVDISRKLIKQLSNQPDCNVYEFSYDWRISCDINSQRFIQFLKSLPSNYDKHCKRKGAIVIAHSLGGVIAHDAMQECPLLFRGLLYCGVPSQCPSIISAFRTGDFPLFGSKNTQINFLTRSSFVLLPLNGEYYEDKDESDIKYQLDFFDVKTWTEFEFSPYVRQCRKRFSQINWKRASRAIIINTENIPSLLRPPQKTQTLTQDPQLRRKSDTFLSSKTGIEYDDAIEYLGRNLKRTKAFLERQDFDPSKRYPPLAVVYGNSLPTVRGARVKGVQGIKDVDSRGLIYGPGDGAVYHKSLMPVHRGFKVVAKIATDRPHVSLMSDMDAVGKALRAILDAEM